MSRIFGLTAMAVLFSLCFSFGATAAVMELFLTHTDDYLYPSANYSTGFDFDLSDVAGVTGVTVSFGSSVHELESWDEGTWGNDDDITFTNLAAMKSALGGTWTIDIAGDSPSSSSFMLTIAGLGEGDFFATPTGLSPAHGATDVPADTAISWVDPTGSSTPYALAVEVESDIGWDYQGILSLDEPGAFPVTSTHWQPPLALADDSYETAVTYVEHDEALASSISVNSGPIIWSASPFAPQGYPATDPLVLKGSETIVAFTVPEPSASAAAGAALVTILFLARLRGRHQSWTL